MQKTLRSLSCLPTIFTPQLPFCRIHQIPGHIHTFLWFSGLPPPSGQLRCQVGLTDKFYKRGIASLDNPPHPFAMLLVVFSHSSHLESWHDGRSYSSLFVTSHGCSAAQSYPLGLRCSVLPASPATAWNVPGFSAHGISLARILEWVDMPSSRASFWPRDWTHISSGSPALSGIFFTTSSTWEAWQAPKEKQKQKEKKKKKLWKDLHNISEPLPQSVPPTCRIRITQERQKSPRKLWVAAYTASQAHVPRTHGILEPKLQTPVQATERVRSGFLKPMPGWWLKQEVERKKEEKKKETVGRLMENTATVFKINIHTLGGGLNI